MTHNLEVIFDNGGGITVQCDAFVHNYDLATQAARDVKDLLAGEDPADWEGNEPGDRIAYTYDEIRNGGYRVLYASDIADAEPIGWANVDDFVAAYRQIAAAEVK